VALSSLAIAVYTFCVLVLRWSVSRYISKLVVLIIWIVMSLVIVIPYICYMKEGIYGDVGYWCWVRVEFRVLQLVTEYIWLWVSLGLMIILYTIMFAVMRGWFIVDNGIWYWYRNYMPRHDGVQPVEDPQEEKESKAIANMMLLYPAVYCICIVFYSIARWMFFLGSTPPHQFTLFTSTLFSLSGTFNAVLFFLTRPDLVIGHDDPLPPIPAIDIQRQSFHERERTSFSSGNFGSLPTPAASDYPPEGTNANLRASRRWMESDMGNYVTYIPGERSYGDFRSVPAPAPVEEERRYGHLPD